MDAGIKVSQPGVNATTTTDPTKLLLNMSWPLHKLDVTKTASFQDINITIKNNPPGPSLASGGYLDTLTTVTTLYQFAHGYTYVPATWFQIQNNILNTGSGPTNALNYQGRFTLVGTASDAMLGNSDAYIGALVDTTNVTIVAVQLLQGLGVAPGPPVINMVGMLFNIRCYVFAESIGNN